MKLVRDKQEIKQPLNNYTVYRHTSPSGKVYIGITKQKPHKRWNSGQPLFERAILKYGWDLPNATAILRGGVLMAALRTAGILNQ